MRLPAALWLGGIVLAAALAVGDDLNHVTDEELAEELRARAADIDRTAERVALLDLEELELSAELENARSDARELDERLAAQAELLYRLSRSGRSLRYLLAADSATEFLKRLQMLRRLVLDGLEERRRAGLRVAEAEGRIADLQDELRRARAMLQQLEMARGELRAEQSRRGGGTGPLRRP